MKLHVDLETLQLIQAPGQRSPLASLKFKRGDSHRLQIQFLENGVNPRTIGDPATLSMRIELLANNAFGSTVLANGTGWVMPAAGDDSPTYACNLELDSAGLNAAMGLGTPPEVTEIRLMGEITWTSGEEGPVSTRTFLVVVENDVIRGEAAPPPPSDGPLAFWKMDSLLDSSGNGNHLTANNTVDTAAGKIGDAQFCWHGSWLSAPAIQMQGRSGTWSMWIRRASPGETGYGYYSAGENGYQATFGFYLADNGYLFADVIYEDLYAGDARLSHTTPLDDDQWHHVVLVSDGTDFKLFVDGDLSSSTDVSWSTGSFLTGTGNFCLNSNALGNFGQAARAYDAVGLWNRALSDAEIQQLYNNGTGLELP